MTIRQETLLDGTRVAIRPLTPQDGALYPDFIAHVTADDLRMRMFTPVGEFTAEMIDRFTHYDPRTAIALIALDDRGAMLGVARLHDDPDGRGAEFAVLVRSALKGHGLGWLLMRSIIEQARRKGLATVHGEVLAENLTMLQMCRELGFGIADEPDEPGVKRVTLRLAP